MLLLVLFIQHCVALSHAHLSGNNIIPISLRWNIPLHEYIKTLSIPCWWFDSRFVITNNATMNIYKLCEFFSLYILLWGRSKSRSRLTRISAITMTVKSFPKSLYRFWFSPVASWIPVVLHSCLNETSQFLIKLLDWVLIF